MSVMKTGTWTRRQFGHMLAGTAAAGVLASCWAEGTARTEQAADGLVFASAMPRDDDGNGSGAIHSFRVAQGAWTPLAVLPSVSPGRLLLHPSLPVVYVLHDVALWEHLPRGAVSAYRFDRAGGTLIHLNTQPLSLAATHPRDGAVFSQGTTLFVTTDAGIHNVLPLRADGGLMPVSAIRKMVSVGAAGSLSVHPDGETLLVRLPGEQVDGFRVVQDDIPEIRRVTVDAGALLTLNARSVPAAAAGFDKQIRGSISGVRSIVFLAA